MAGLELATQVLVGKYYPEEKHPISVFLHRIYERPCRFVLRHAKATIAVAVLLVLATIPVFLKLGSRVHAAASTKAPCSTCPPPCRASARPRPSASSRSRTA